jgi:glycyl-tRNA synthetase
MAQFERNRRDLEDLTRRRFFFRPGAEIYGGVSGFFTYGPPGCALKTNIIQQWRNHFIIEEQMMEIEDTNIMPHQVLKASGHVDRFSDFLVRDVNNSKTFFRADKLLEEVMDKKMKEDGASAEKIQEYQVVRNMADGYSKQELMEVFNKYNVRVPENGNALTEPEPFNLMFPTPIGPAGLIQGYLRPETAQGIFLNYKFCLEQNANKLPFGVAQVGKVYRNEIAPRQGLTRQREFSQMEIEWFVKPTAKDHPKFKTVKNLKLQLFPSKEQLAGEPHLEMEIGEAVAKGIVNNETLGYLIARTFLFLVSLGMKKEHVRFRQHLPTEMAHYAADCWDAECEISIGWLEIVGIADRACFDLNAHAQAAKVDLMFRETLDPPIEIEVTRITKAAGIAAMKAFKKQGKAVKEWLEALPETDLRSLADEVKAKGQAVRSLELSGENQECTFLPEHVAVETKKEKQTTTTFMPGVVEPSFGIDRIFTSCLEHCYYARPKEEGEDAKQIRGVLSFPAAIAPYKMTILPVDQRVTREERYIELMKTIRTKVSSLGHSCTVDDSNATIGKRYSRNDELGIPFACTVDFDSLQDNTVTLRERDSMEQVRMPSAEVGSILHDICWGRKSWKDVQSKYSSFSGCK